MRQSDIKVGRCYTNGKGTVRKVLDVRLNEVSFIIVKGRNSPFPYIFKDNFARWAKAEVPCGEGGE